MIQQILSVRIDRATPTDVEQPWSLGLDGSYVQSVCLSPAPSVMDSSMVSWLRPYPPLYVQTQWHRKFPCTWFSFATTMATSTITSLIIKFDCFLSLDNIVVYCCIAALLLVVVTSSCVTAMEDKTRTDTNAITTIIFSLLTVLRIFKA
jgi:hypothetical protein